MTNLTIEQSIHAQINETFPRKTCPRQNMLLMARYATSPDPTPQFEAAELAALKSARRMVELNPLLPESEMEYEGLSLFQREFDEQLRSEWAATWPSVP